MSRNPRCVHVVAIAVQKKKMQSPIVKVLQTYLYLEATGSFNVVKTKGIFLHLRTLSFKIKRSPRLQEVMATVTDFLTLGEVDCVLNFEQPILDNYRN